ncbi:vacuolar fusion protein CCZ1 homolog, partial [Limulus polyphemus]|uniref:Vacuolar fusion protein CCZ1 homolog n=1 Tax=Limulus polyphemus TaxID=6850 RepID=A0ABM1BR35_LIMPO
MIYMRDTVNHVDLQELKKILYYYPDLADTDTKIKNVGLCEALIKFTETFNPSKACEALHTQKTRQLFYQAETDFWMAMTVNVPTQQRTRDGQVYIEYLADDVQDHVYKSILKTSYLMFRLFNGTFQRILSKSGNSEMLKEKLSAFYKKYLPILKLSQADLLDVYQGIHFLPLDKYAFLKVQCFVNLLEANFSHIKYTAFLYNDQLVWSGLEQDNMQVLYMYLTLSLIPSFLETEIQGGSVMPSTKVGLGSHYG